MNNAKKDKKRLHPGVKVLIILLGAIAVLGLTVAALGLNLLNRISRPGSLTPEPVESSLPTPEPTDEAPHMTPTPTRTPVGYPHAGAGGHSRANSRPAERILRADAAHGGAACPVRCG